VPDWLLVFNATVIKGPARQAPAARGAPIEPEGALVPDRASAGPSGGFRFATTAIDTQSAYGFVRLTLPAF
jgi:hypothetical protein